MNINSLIKSKYFKILSIALLVVLLLVIAYFKFTGNRFMDIDDSKTPISDQVNSCKAKFYVIYNNPNYDTFTSLTSYRFVGDGYISIDGIDITKRLVIDNIDSYLSYVPDYSNILDSNSVIDWKTIRYTCGQYFVLGEISNNPSKFMHLNAGNISDYIVEAEAISNSISPSATYYFASDGDDRNSGLSPDSPKRTPTDYLRNGNCNVLFKSGDYITLKWSIGVGSNVRISTYGGSERAVLNWTPVNTQTFSLYDSDNNIYSAQLDYLTDSHLNISYLILTDYDDVNWQKVFNYSDLLYDGDFYVDRDRQTLYMKSDYNMEGKAFAYGSGAGAFTFRDGSNGIIENVEIVGGGMGINVKKYSNFVCRNCYVHHAGGIANVSKNDGSFYRYGNGIQLWTDDIHNAYVYDNIVTDIFDAGITPQISGSATKASDNIKIFNNYIDRCLYSIEYFQHGTTAETYDIVFANNLMSNAIDITNGYRYATYGYNSYFCLWSSKSEKSNILITNNFGFAAPDYAYAFYQDTPDGVNNYDNNTLVIVNKEDADAAVKNSRFYDGPTEDVVTTDFGSQDYYHYFHEFKKRVSEFDCSSIYFETIRNLLASIEADYMSTHVEEYSQENDIEENTDLYVGIAQPEEAEPESFITDIASDEIIENSVDDAETEEAVSPEKDIDISNNEVD